MITVKRLKVIKRLHDFQKNVTKVAITIKLFLYLPLQPKWSEPRALFSITIPSPTLEFLMFDFSTVGKCNKSKLTPFLIFWPYTQKSPIKNFTSASSPTRYCSISSLASEECPTSSKFSVASPPFYCRTTNH